MFAVLGASFHVNPVSTCLETSWTPHRLVKAADVQAVRVSTAKKLENTCVILQVGNPVVAEGLSSISILVYTDNGIKVKERSRS